MLATSITARSLALALLAASILLAPGPVSARSPVRIGIGDESPAMFASPRFQQLGIRRTRYFVPADVMRDAVKLARATEFVDAARDAGVSVLLHVSTSDLRPRRGPLVSTHRYGIDAVKLVSYFRALGVRDFGAWNEANHKTQETYDHPGYAAAYFKAMYRAVRMRCRSCPVVGLDVLDQRGVERYMRSFYRYLGRTWSARLGVVGIHNYADVNRGRTSGTRSIIAMARRYNRHTKFWFTETGALVAFHGSLRYDEARQASRIRTMFDLAGRFRGEGVQRVYSYNWFGIETGGCALDCRFDAGLVGSDGAPRPVFDVFAARLRDFSR